MHSPLRTAVSRTGTAGVALALAVLLAGCGTDDVAVEVGEARTSNTGPIAGSVSPTASPTLSPYLSTEPSVIGDMTLHLPIGWTTFEGQPVATAGEGAEVQGAAQLTTVPAEGKTAQEWADEIVAGESTLVNEGEGLTLNDPLVAPGEREVLHVSHDYADGRANFFVTVEADSLYLLRFGGDGSTRAQLAVAEAASTITIQVQSRPTGTTTPSDGATPTPTAGS